MVSDTGALTPKQELFVQEYLVDLNATAAYKRAGYSVKSDNVAAVESSRLLSNPKVASRIQEAMKARSERIEISQDRVLKEWWNMLTADANELVEYRRTCCRYCYGEGFKYQRTAGEMESDRERYQRDLLKAQKEDPEAPIQEFNEAGGIGYDPRKSPHPDCPECFGEGVGAPFIKDTRNLSSSARSLYAGVKVTKDGIQVLQHSKDRALEMVGRHFGMFTDKTELSGPNGGPIPLTLDQIAANPNSRLKVK